MQRIIRKVQEILRLTYDWLAILLPSCALTSLADEALRFRHRLNDAVRRKKARTSPIVEPPIMVAGNNSSRLQREVGERRSSWSVLPIPPCPIPSMLTRDEMRYYHYITGFYSGNGAVVEIGPWIGSSTYNIVGGLLDNPDFTAKPFEKQKLYVFDDFVWRSSWMDKWLVDTVIQLPDEHASFLPLFQEMTEIYADHIEAQVMKVMNGGDNDHVPWFKWEQGLVELCFIDCGRALEMNEKWFRELEPYFIPDQTIIVMQDWQNFKNVPEVYWENTKMFTDSKGGKLDQIHELRHSGTATFIYRG